MSIGNPRRYYLLKAIADERDYDGELSPVWRAKQAEIAGTALPVDFPHREQLAAAGYSAIEDLAGTDADELSTSGLNRSQAAGVLRALAQIET